MTSATIRLSKHSKVEESAEVYEQLLLDSFSAKFAQDTEFIAEVHSDRIEVCFDCKVDWNLLK